MRQAEMPERPSLYDWLFSDPQPDAGGKDFIVALNPNSLKVVFNRVTGLKDSWGK